MSAPRVVLLALVALPIHVACSDSSEFSGDDSFEGDAGKVPPASAVPASAEDAGTTPSADYRGKTPPHQALLKAGLHPDASDWLRTLGVTAGQLTQTLGSAAASAGTHEKDGDANGLPYAAAADFSVKLATGALKSEEEIEAFLTALTSIGYAGWYRKPGFDGWPASEAPHIHAIYVGCAMKLSVRNQMRDFFAGKNGLASHKTYAFYTWSPQEIENVKSVYVKYNSLTD